jgi:hypothetical protein
MFLKKYFFLTVVFVTSAQCLGSPSQANRKLWYGVLNSNAKLVRNALHEGADLGSRFGPYGDTALMASLRIHYNNVANNNTGNSAASTGKTIVAFCGALTTSILLSKLFKENDSAKSISDSLLYADSIVTQLISVAVFTAIDKLPVKVTSSSAVIIELLIEATTPQDLYLRNKEGLTALEVLNAYHHVAYQHHDEAWHIFSSLLHQKES